VTGDVASPRNTLIYYTARGDLEGIREGAWKLLVKKPRGNRNKKKPAPQPQILLFNLKEDISETTNLADKHKGKVAELTALMKKLDDEITANARPVWRVEE
jgi:arylsulfatase A